MVFGTNIYQRIESVNFDWLVDAEWFTNSLPGSDKPGKWFSDLTALDYDRPFHRSTLGSNHTYFVIDFDVGILATPYGVSADPLLLRNAKIHVAISFVRQWLNDHPQYRFFAKLSGSGIHLIQRIDEQINPRRMMPVTRSLFPKCPSAPEFPKGGKFREHVCDVTCKGWHNPYEFDKKSQLWRPWRTRWSKIVIIDGYKARITIDLNLFYRIHMIRWTYSRNMKIPQRFNYAIPIDQWNTSWVLEHMYREALEPHKYHIPKFQFHDQLIPDSEAYKITFRKRSLGPDSAEWYKIDIAEPDTPLTQTQQGMIRTMEDRLLGDETVVPPCMSVWYQRTKTEKGIFWGRLPWIRWLANKGFSPNQIALLLRFRVNDELDNSEGRKHILHELMPWAYGPKNKPFKPPGCDILRGVKPSDMEVAIATREMCEICTRQYPLQKFQEDRTITGIKDVGFKEIQIKCMRVVDELSDQDVVIRKATRAGVTTTMIPITNTMNRKLLAVVPTNRIGRETFVKAVALSKEKFGIEVNGAMFASNKDTCLLLTFLNEELKRRVNPSISSYPTWVGSKVAWSALRYHSKPSCKSCMYRHEIFTIPIMRNNVPVPLISSEIKTYSDDKDQRDGICAYQTLYKYIRDLDVVFITYSKLYALFQTQTDEADYFREQLFDCFDILLLDEISYLTNQSALHLQVLKSSSVLPGDPRALYSEKYVKNVFVDLLQETRELRNYRDNKITRTMEEIVLQFVEKYDYFIDNPPTEIETQVIKNFLGDDTKSDLEIHFSVFHTIIEKIAIEKNIALSSIEALLFLLKEEYWMQSSMPTKFHPVNVSFISKPATGNIQRFVRDFSSYPNKQVIITDATMPYIKMSDFFQIPFTEFEVGDPRHTNSGQLVITDSRNMNVINLFFSEKSEEFQSDFISYVKIITKAHNRKSIMIVAPNIRTATWIQHEMKIGTIPRCQVTWYRSDLTVGVESKKRVMIVVCPPFPPRGSHDWLAFYFHLSNIHTQLTVRELGDKLAETSAKVAFYQTIGRAKDPEVKERSIIYCWGISGGRSSLDLYGSQTAVDLMVFDDNVPIPNILTPSYLDARTEFIINLGKIWMEKGILFPNEIVRIASMAKRQGTIKESQVSRSLRISRSKLGEILTPANITLLKMLGISTTEEYSAQARNKRIRRFTSEKSNNVSS